MRYLPWVPVLLAAICISAQAQRRTPSGYEIGFKDHLQISEPLRLSANSRVASVGFYTERRSLPGPGSALHLFIRHSSTLDTARSFLSVTLNYGLLRSLRLDDNNESLTEIVIPINAELLKDKNEFVFSAELFPSPNLESTQSWTEITNRSYISIVTKERAPSFDLQNLPLPLIDANSYRDQHLDVLVSGQPSTATLEATALTIANLISHNSPRQPILHAVRSIADSNNPLVIIGTREEQPQIRLLQTSVSGTSSVRLMAKTAGSHGQILLITGETPSEVLNSANNLFKRSEVLQREWRGFVPPQTHFALRDLGLNDLTIRPEPGGTALIPLNFTPDTRFLNYGMQAEFTIDVGESAISSDSYIEIFLNERSVGRFSVIRRLTGSQVSLQFNVPGAALKNQNVLRIVWSNGDHNHVTDGVGWILSSSKFYLPRDYSSELPDLALLQRHLFPFSLKPDLSDTVVVVPDAPSQETLAAVFELAANLGRVAPSDRVAFNVRRNGELTSEMKSGAHLILLDHRRTIGNEIDSFENPVIQEAVSPWNSTRYVLSIAPGKSDNLQNVVHTLFADGILDRLQDDTVYLTASGPVCFMLNSRRTVAEYSYLMHIEAWMQLNWIALPVILAVASGILFMGVRLALDHYKANAPESTVR